MANLELEAFFRRNRAETDTEQVKQEELNTSSEINSELQKRAEKNRRIAHIGRVFARRYNIQVLPSRQKGLWATSLDPKINIELERYLNGQRETLDDLPEESFIPKQILYDAESAQEMSWDQINTILHHEAGHAKFSDFRMMVEGQKQAINEGYLPTSFFLMFEGIEDPRVNALEGEESPAIDRQIRTNQANDLKDRLTEVPLSQRPKLLQFAYDSFHIWLHNEPIEELKNTDVGEAIDKVRPLLEQYFQNTDVEQRKILQKQIWDVAKELEKKEIEEETQRQMAQQRQKDGKQGSGGQQSEQSGDGGQTAYGSQRSSGQQPGAAQSGEQGGFPTLKGEGTTGQSPSESRQGESGERGDQQDGQPKGHKRFMDRMKEAFFGKNNVQPSNDKSQSQDIPISNQANSKKSERIDLSKLSVEELKEIKEAIENSSPEQRQELLKKAKEAVDEAQKEALEEDFSKTMKLQKNKQTGEYVVNPQTTNEQTQKEAIQDFRQAITEVDAEEQAEYERQEAERQLQETLMKQLDQARREKIEMEKAGFLENERDLFLLYQQLEDSMYSYVRRFKQAIEKVIPRRKEPLYEGGHFSGPRFDRRDVVRRAPLGDERFHMRQIEKPTGSPRLFIGLLVDNSGSMSGKKMEEARKTMIFFAKVCRDMGIPCMVSSFGDDAEVIKEFRQDFDDRGERIKPKLLNATDADGGSTNLHAGIEITIEAMNEQRRRISDSHGLIFVITDGGANRGLTGDALRDYIDENRGRLTFKGFGLSANSYERDQIQNYLNTYFGESNCAYPENFEDLPDEAFRLLRINLMQFQRFLS